MARPLLGRPDMSPTRIAVYAVAVLVAVFGIVFVADALVESDEERLEGLVAALLDARPDRRADRIAAWSGDESVAVVADGQRTWLDPEEGPAAVRSAIAEALPELADAEIVQHASVLTGRRGRITLRARDADGPIDASIELALEDDRFTLLEVRRMR
jgi:hypothetical protein